MQAVVKIVAVQEAEKKLAQLIQEADNGEEILIARGSKIVARLIAVGAQKRRRPGSLKGGLHVGPEFFEPLPTDEI